MQLLERFVHQPGEVVFDLEVVVYQPAQHVADSAEVQAAKTRGRSTYLAVYQGRDYTCYYALASGHRKQLAPGSGLSLLVCRRGYAVPAKMWVTGWAELPAVRSPGMVQLIFHRA